MADSTIRRVTGNAMSLLTSDVVNRGTTFILYALIARYLGAREFGQISLAFTLFYLFLVLATMGLRTFIIREVANDRTKTDKYLINGSVIVVVFSIVSIASLVLFVKLMGYAEDTAFIICLLSLGLLPQSLSIICEAVFQAWERMVYIAYSNVTANIAKAGLAVLLLTLGCGLIELVMVLLATRIVVVCFQWWLMLHNIIRPKLKIDLNFCVGMIKRAVVFLGIDGVLVILNSINIILLSKLAGEREVGFYNAAGQLLLPARLVIQSTVLSIFPIMSRKFKAGVQSLKGISEHLIELLLAIGLPATVGLFFLADKALLLIYGGKEFLLATAALRIMVWGLISIALTSALGQVLLASQLERVNLRIVIVKVCVNFILGFILISQLGLLGAALTALSSRVISFFLHYFPVSRQLFKIKLSRLAWKPIMASMGMGIYLALDNDQSLVLSIIFGGLLYAALLAILTVCSIGGLDQLKTRYRYLIS